LAIALQFVVEHRSITGIDVNADEARLAQLELVVLDWS
jgi:hypothetical protein